MGNMNLYVQLMNSLSCSNETLYILFDINKKKRQYIIVYICLEIKLQLEKTNK